MRRSASSSNTPESDPQSAGQIDAHRAPDGSLHDAIARQRLAMDAEGADAEGRYQQKLVLKHTTDAHLHADNCFSGCGGEVSAKTNAYYGCAPACGLEACADRRILSGLRPHTSSKGRMH